MRKQPKWSRCPVSWSILENDGGDIGLARRFLGVTPLVAQHNLAWVIGLGVAAGLLIFIAILISLNNTAFAQSRLPTLEWKTTPHIRVAVRPRTGTSTKRLKDFAITLSKDIHTYVLSQSLSWSTSGHSATTREMSPAASLEEKNAIWTRFMDASMRQSQRERQELNSRFGGRVQYALADFLALGLISEEDTYQLMWEIVIASLDGGVSRQT